jgi:hypothetical protein
MALREVVRQWAAQEFLALARAGVFAGRRYAAVVDTVFQAEGIEVLLTLAQALGRTPSRERWLHTVRQECLDRILIYDTRHLLALLGEYPAHNNRHRAYQGRGQRPPVRDALPAPVTDRDSSATQEGAARADKRV